MWRKWRRWSQRGLSVSERTLGLIFLLKFIEAFAYFSLSQVLVLHLSSDPAFHFSDQHAGTLYGFYGASVSLFGILIGKKIDGCGEQTSLRLGFLIAAVARGLLALTNSTPILYLSILVLLPLASALGIPVMVIAIRRVTTEEERPVAFGIFYSILNLGALCAGFLVDAITLSTAADKANRVVFSICAAASFVGLLVSSQVHVGHGKKNGEERLDGLRETFKDPRFQRFFVFSLIMTNLRSMFRHLDGTLPKYLIRVHGASVPKGLIYAINPALIICLVPIITAYTSHMRSMVIIEVGSYVSALSAVHLMLSHTITGAVLFVSQLSLGEALWSPRFMEYQVSVAPEGQEAFYMALGQAPLFLSKLPVGYLSGWLVHKYIPKALPCEVNNTTCSQWIDLAGASCSTDFCRACGGTLAGMCESTCHPECKDCVDSLMECWPSHKRCPECVWAVIGGLGLLSPILISAFRARLVEPKVAQVYKQVHEVT